MLYIMHTQLCNVHDGLEAMTVFKTACFFRSWAAYPFRP